MLAQGPRRTVNHVNTAGDPTRGAKPQGLGLRRVWGRSVVAVTALVAINSLNVLANPAQAVDCVSRSEYQRARAAWEMEGMTRHGAPGSASTAPWSLAWTG